MVELESTVKRFYLIKKLIKRFLSALMSVDVCVILRRYYIPWRFLPAKTAYIYNNINYVVNCPRPKKAPSCDVIIAASDNQRAVLRDGRRYAQLIDSFGSDLEKRGLRVAAFATPYSRWTGQRAYREPYHLNDAHLWYFLYADTGSYRAKYHFLKLNQAYDRFFEQTEAKIVVACAPYGHFIRAAKRNGLLVYELMHGYGYTQIHERYNKRKLEFLPDGFISLDKTTHDALKKIVPPRELLRNRHPWLTRFIDNDAIPEEWQVPHELKDKLKHYERVALFSLQWGYDGEIVEFDGILANGIIHEQVIEAIKNTSSTIAWIIRLHPVQSASKKYTRHRKYIADLEKCYENVFVKDIGSVPIASLLNVCHVHITMCSMVCYEAAWSGLSSLMLCPSVRRGGHLEGHFQDLVTAEYITKMPAEAKDIKAWINSKSRARLPLTSVFFDGDEAACTIASYLTARPM